MSSNTITATGEDGRIRIPQECTSSVWLTHAGTRPWRIRVRKGTTEGMTDFVPGLSVEAIINAAQTKDDLEVFLNAGQCVLCNEGVRGPDPEKPAPRLTAAQQRKADEQAAKNGGNAEADGTAATGGEEATS